MYQTAVPVANTMKKDPWIAPTIGFPPPPPPPTTSALAPPFQPLHVWGHPTAPDPSMAHAWPRHLAPRPPVLPWGHSAVPMGDSSYWHHHYHAVLALPLPHVEHSSMLNHNLFNIALFLL
jgi:hypothetical protein